MPSGERINTNSEPVTSEVANETPRSTYEARGEKANQSVINEAAPTSEAGVEKPRISDLDLEGLLSIDLSTISERELLEAKARLEEERRALTELESQTAMDTEAVEPTSPEPNVTDSEVAISKAAPSAIPISEPELKASFGADLNVDTSGIDVIVADEPDPSMDSEMLVDPNAETVALEPVRPEDFAHRVETISPDEARATYEKAKQKSGPKNFFKEVFAKKVMPVVLAALVVGSSIFGVFASAANNNQDQPAQPPAIEQVADDQSDDTDDIDLKGSLSTQAEDESEQATSHEADQNFRDGYDKQGMYSSANKSGAYDFASAAEVSDVCHGDKTEMVKYVAGNQSETLADYIAHLPSDLQPEGFKGLSILDAEHKLDSLSDAEYQSVLDQFNQAMDKSKTQEVVLDGSYHNAYMYKDAGAPVNHDNIQLVECVTDETGTEATKYIFYDDNGNEIGSMTVKTKECMQAVDHIDSDTTVYVGMPSVPDNPTPDSDPGTGDEGTGDEGTGSEGTGTEGTGSEGNEDTGSEDTGDEGTGTEGTGSEGNEDTGSEDTGDEGTGSEDTGEEDTGSEDTGEEDTGSEDTGEEDTGQEDTGEEDTGSEDTGEETTGSEDTGDEGTDIEQKDYENMERIDNQILDDIADDVGTDEVRVTPTDEVSQDDITEQPTADDYQGTEADIVQNDVSQDAEPVQDQISEVNDYSQDQGGANADEYAPVQADEEAQAAADAAETPVNQAPTGGDELDDILGDLGIN